MTDAIRYDAKLLAVYKNKNDLEGIYDQRNITEIRNAIVFL